VRALFEKYFWMRRLQVVDADLGAWNMRSDGQDRHAAPVTVEQAVDKVQISRAAAAGTDCELSSEMRFGAGRKGRTFLVPYMYPLNLLQASQRIGEGVQRVADHTVNSLHTSLN
jgi:hypothetical protein